MDREEGGKVSRHLILRAVRWPGKMRLGEGFLLGVGPAVEVGAMEIGPAEEEAEEKEGCAG